MHGKLLLWCNISHSVWRLFNWIRAESIYYYPLFAYTCISLQLHGIIGTTILLLCVVTCAFRSRYSQCKNGCYFLYETMNGYHFWGSVTHLSNTLYKLCMFYQLIKRTTYASKALEACGRDMPQIRSWTRHFTGVSGSVRPRPCFAPGKRTPSTHWIEGWRGGGGPVPVWTQSLDEESFSPTTLEPRSSNW
jgi:hypothetical protein